MFAIYKLTLELPASKMAFPRLKNRKIKTYLTSLIVIITVHSAWKLKKVLAHICHTWCFSA